MIVRGVGHAVRIQPDSLDTGTAFWSPVEVHDGGGGVGERLPDLGRPRIPGFPLERLLSVFAAP